VDGLASGLMTPCLFLHRINKKDSTKKRAGKRWEGSSVLQACSLVGILSYTAWVYMLDVATPAVYAPVNDEESITSWTRDEWYWNRLYAEVREKFVVMGNPCEHNCNKPTGIEECDGSGGREERLLRRVR
jgi:hypothetical protein